MAQHKLSVAPMMGWTDRHFRALLRLFTRHTLLYTELIPTGAVLAGDAARILRHSPVERPLAAQFGGSDPGALAECAAIAEEHGFDEVNLNAGCPSERVKQGGFGAVLMTQPDQVAAMVRAMRRATRLPVTVKHRIGVAPDCGADSLRRFVGTLRDAGVDGVIVHARAAILDKRVSPKQNRKGPPLQPDVVFALKSAYPDLPVTFNGEVRDLAQARALLAPRADIALDGVMIGRAAYARPLLFVDADELICGPPHGPPWAVAAQRPNHPVDAVRLFLPYLRGEMAAGTPLKHVARHLLNVFCGATGARAWRRALSTLLRSPAATVDDIEGLSCRMRI
jgi:tRNA-dihydrouridine synthase A